MNSFLTTTYVIDWLAIDDKYVLIDENNEPRPVGFISLGGASRGSALEGHGYTYQGAKWGRIADVVMNSKCLNPIL